MKRKLMTILMLWTVVLGLTGVAQAELVRWYFNDTTFYDGTEITGYFDYNTDTGGIANRDFTTQNGFNYNGTVPMAGYSYNNTNGPSSQYIDTGNSYGFESTLHFQTTSVWENSTTRTFWYIDVINPDSTGLSIDLSQEGTYVYQPLNGNFGYESFLTYYYTETGDYISYDNTYRYLNAVTLTTTDPSAPVPEPATMLLLGSGLIGLAGFRRKKFKK